jgi:nucleotide-binding universal stress UspA family protein
MSGIVLTTDLSDESTRAFAPTLKLAKKLGLPITLLAVLENVPFEMVTGGGLVATYPDQEGIKAAWKKRLTELSHQLKGVKVTTKLIEGNDIAKGIAEFAKAEAADYVSMATHGRSGLRRMLLGSIAEAVIRNSHVPVVVFPPP